MSSLPDTPSPRNPLPDAVLLKFANSPDCTPMGMMEQGEVGEMHRDAWCAVRRLKAEDSATNQWFSTPADRYIKYLLEWLNLADTSGGRAAAQPFRIVDWRDRRWIAALVPNGTEGIIPELQVAAVILYDPASKEVAIEDGPAVILPPNASAYTELRIYSEALPYFRQWALMRTEGMPRLPGAFALGDLSAVPWGRLPYDRLRAGPGVDPEALRLAVLASANLPSVDGER